MSFCISRTWYLEVVSFRSSVNREENEKSWSGRPFIYIYIYIYILKIGEDLILILLVPLRDMS